MDGVTIISATAQGNEKWWCVATLVTLGIILGVSAVCNKKWRDAVICLITLVAAIGIADAVINQRTGFVEKPKYIATISESVRLVDFVAKYELLWNDGNKYCISERDGGE